RMIADYEALYTDLLLRRRVVEPDWAAVPTDRTRALARSGTNCKMCGLTGIFDPRSPTRCDEALLRRMNDIQHHRGPDEGSIHIEAHVGLGHRRLSIIDVATGQQPLFNEDGTVVVVLNGEIYNFEALRAELEA